MFRHIKNNHKQDNRGTKKILKETTENRADS